MIKINENFMKLPGSYLFSTIAKKVATYQAEHPDADVIRMGIGDVTRPLPDACISAMHAAVDDMTKTETFHGYGPEQGYAFVVDKIIENDFASRGIQLDRSEVFLSDGSKSDTGNIGDILGTDNRVMVTDPVYPVYVDTNAMAGRAGYIGDNGKWSEIVYAPCTWDNGFIPALPSVRRTPDVIYLCFPNNPTGTTLTYDQLKVWVDYARQNNALILYDVAYEAYISESNVPHSIYEIEGAKTCAIEFHSFSKNAGFTGVRCAYTVIPKEVTAVTSTGETVELRSLWNRRHTTKFNGVSYITQKAAEAVYSEEGKRQVRELVDYYMGNAKIISQALDSVGIQHVGGVNSPYVWLRTPNGIPSWDFFDKLLNEANVVGTPGVGFGPSGEGGFRLTAFNTKENTEKAMERITKLKF